MSTPNRRPGTTWFMRQVSVYPNGYVTTHEGDLVGVYYFDSFGDAQTILLRRRDARLLAKRINQCLDDTRKS